MRSPYPTHRHAAAACRKDGGQPANRYTGAGARQGGDCRGSPALADLERQGKGCADYSRAPPHRHAGLPGRRRREKGSVVTPAALREIDRYLTSQSAWLVNYAERHRAGLRVGTSITEGTANFLVNRRMNKSQQGPAGAPISCSSAPSSTASSDPASNRCS